MAEAIKFNLVPTSQIAKYANVLDGGLKLREISIGLGKGTEKTFDPVKLVSELARVNVHQVQFIKEKSTYTLKMMPVKFSEKISQYQGRVCEIGLFVKTSSTDRQGTLVAYYRQETPISIDKLLTLTLLLPFPEEDKKEVVEATEDALGQDSGLQLFAEVLPHMALASTKSAWEIVNSSNKKASTNHYWGEDSKTERVCENELTHIAAAFNSGNSKIYLLYKEKFEPKLFFRNYELATSELREPMQFITFKEKVKDRAGKYSIFGKTENDRFKCYLSHPKGVFAVTAGFTKDIIPSYKQQYHPSIVEDDTTLFNLGNNACLAGGSMAGWKTGKAFAANGQKVEGNSCLGPINNMDEERVNPIVDYDEEKIVIIGGDEETTETTTETVIETIIVDETIVDNERFAYFAHIKPKKQAAPKISYSGTNAKELTRVNARDHINCRLGKEIFIFPKDMFKDENQARYFVYNSDKKTVIAYELPEAMRKAVSDAKMQTYDSIQVASTDKGLAYFFLNKPSKKDGTFATQVLYLNINP